MFLYNFIKHLVLTIAWAVGIASLPCYLMSDNKNYTALVPLMVIMFATTIVYTFFEQGDNNG